MGDGSEKRCGECGEVMPVCWACREAIEHLDAQDCGRGRNAPTNHYPPACIENLRKRIERIEAAAAPVALAPEERADQAGQETGGPRVTRAPIEESRRAVAELEEKIAAAGPGGVLPLSEALLERANEIGRDDLEGRYHRVHPASFAGWADRARELEERIRVLEQRAHHLAAHAARLHRLAQTAIRTRDLARERAGDAERRARKAERARDAEHAGRVELRRELRKRIALESEEPWRWMADGRDELETLTGPVLIDAADLRELLERELEAAAAPTKPEPPPCTEIGRLG